MTEEERTNRNAVMAGWVVRLVETYDGPRPVVLTPSLRAIFVEMQDGRSLDAITSRMGGEAWMAVQAVATAAAWATTQQFRVPSMVVPMLVEFRDWLLSEAARLRWGLMGFGAEEAQFLSSLGHLFVEYAEASDGGSE